MDLGFRGEVADFYHRYRHGYPAPVIDALVDAFGLTGRDLVVDLGCGTGQLALPIAARVRAVIGMDPEPDMLARARLAAREAGTANAAWLVGSDADLPGLRALAGDQSVGAVTIGQALHWMNDQELFRAALPLLRAGGGIAVVTNGTPQWLQDSDWSRALRDFLAGWLHTELTATCGTDEASQRRYQEHLAAAGLEVRSAAVDHDVSLDFDQILGGVYSALPLSKLPAPDQRQSFAARLRAALPPRDSFREHVRVTVQLGQLGQPGSRPAPPPGGQARSAGTG